MNSLPSTSSDEIYQKMNWIAIEQNYNKNILPHTLKLQNWNSQNRPNFEQTCDISEASPMKKMKIKSNANTATPCDLSSEQDFRMTSTPCKMSTSKYSQIQPSSSTPSKESSELEIPPFKFVMGNYSFDQSDDKSLSEYSLIDIDVNSQEEMDDSFSRSHCCSSFMSLCENNFPRPTLDKEVNSSYDAGTRSYSSVKPPVSTNSYNNICKLNNGVPPELGNLSNSYFTRDSSFAQMINELINVGMMEGSISGFIDTHCHLDLLFKKLEYNGTFESFYKEWSNCFPSNFDGCIAIFCHPSSFYKSYRYTKLLEEPRVWGAFGCHPHYANFFTPKVESLLSQCIMNDKVLAVGEIGLDYSERNRVDREIQKNIFVKQILTALSFNKPIMIHCRDADQDCLQILKKLVPRNYLVHRHCFTGDLREATEWLSTFPNLHISFTCLITYYKKSILKELREAVTKIPLDRIMLETDAPYFIPTSLQNYSNNFSNPGMAIYVAAEIAFLKKIHLFEVFKIVRQNTKRFYNI